MSSFKEQAAAGLEAYLWRGELPPDPLGTPFDYSSHYLYSPWSEEAMEAAFPPGQEHLLERARRCHSEGLDPRDYEGFTGGWSPATLLLFGGFVLSALTSSELLLALLLLLPGALAVLALLGKTQLQKRREREDEAVFRKLLGLGHAHQFSTCYPRELSPLDLACLRFYRAPRAGEAQEERRQLLLQAALLQQDSLTVGLPERERSTLRERCSAVLEREEALALPAQTEGLSGEGRRALAEAAHCHELPGTPSSGAFELYPAQASAAAAPALLALQEEHAPQPLEGAL